MPAFRTISRVAIPFVAVCLLQAGTTVFASPVLEYDPATGNVVINTDGVGITNFDLQNDAGGPNFLPGNADFSGLGTPLVPPDANALQLAWTAQDLTNGFNGTADIGDVFPTGLATEADVLDFLTTRLFALAPLTSGESGEFGVVIVPEPSSLVMGLLGMGIGLLGFRRRR